MSPSLALAAQGRISVTPWSASVKVTAAPAVSGRCGDRARDEQIPDLGADRVFHPRPQVGDLGHSAANPRGSLGGDADQQGLRPDGDVDRALGEPPMGKLEAEPADLDDAGVVVDAAEQALDAIGLAHEAGDEHVAGRVVEVAGRALLGDHAAVHHDDPVGDRQRLLLVVGHVDHGDAEPPLQLADLLAHAAAQPRVQVGQRLVEQEHGRLEDEGAGDGHALLLAARQLAGQPVPEGVEADRGEAGARQSPRLPPAPPGDARPVGDVVEHAHVREQRIALEHHADVAPGRADVGDVAVADQDAAGRRRLEAGDQAERRRLAAARGAEQGDEAAGLDGEAHVANRGHLAIGLAHALEHDARGASAPAHAARPVTMGAGAAPGRRRRRSPTRSWISTIAASMSRTRTEL